MTAKKPDKSGLEGRGQSNDTLTFVHLMFTHMNRSHLRQNEGDLYHRLANRADCKVLRTLRPFDTVHLFACEEHKRRKKRNASLTVTQEKGCRHRWRDTASVQRNYSQSCS